MRVVPQVDMDSKYWAKFFAKETETDGVKPLELAKVVPVVELVSQLQRLGFGHDQVSATLANFARERAFDLTCELSSALLASEGFTADA